MAATRARSRTVVQHSVTLSESTSAGVSARAGKRGFSAYVDAATARQLERDALADILAEMREKHGEPDAARVAALRDELGW